MKVIIDTNVFPPRKYYVEVEPKFTEFTESCRVLPTTYFDEPNTMFFLKAKYAPGDKKTFTNGGFENGLSSWNINHLVNPPTILTFPPTQVSHVPGIYNWHNAPEFINLGVIPC
jgi:hypothetical protein